MKGLGTWVRRYLFGRPRTEGAEASARAIEAADNLVQEFRGAFGVPGPIRAMFAEMWLVRDDETFVESVYREHQERMEKKRDKK